MLLSRKAQILESVSVHHFINYLFPCSGPLASANWLGEAAVSACQSKAQGLLHLPREAVAITLYCTTCYTLSLEWARGHRIWQENRARQQRRLATAPGT